MNTLSGFKLSQDPDELKAFCALIKEMRAERYLEIGARCGDTFFEVVRSMPEQSTAVAVDLPAANWGRKGSFSYLQKCVDALSGTYDVHVIRGHSQHPETIAKIKKHAPYDVVFIDADHLYEAVKADWEVYRQMARVVAFHDIAGEGVKKNKMQVEVPKLWKEIKQKHEHKEIISEGSLFGIGVVWL